MSNPNLTNEIDQSTRQIRRAAAIIAAVATVVWGTAAVLTSEDTATSVVDESTPVTPSENPENPEIVEPSPAVSPTEPAGQTDPPQPQVPVGGNGDLATPPITEPPSCNGLCVAPVDLHPVEIDFGHTPVVIGLANSVAGGCSSECITRAQVFQSDGTTDVDIEVETHTPAFIAIYVDDEQPHVTDDGRPYFPGSQPVLNTHGDLDTWFADTLTGLNEETEYWVIVRATDADVRSSYFVGSVVTPRMDDDVVVAFAAIDLIFDGDHGRNKGELTFEWYADLDRIGRNGEHDRSDGDRINLTHEDNVVGVYDLSVGEVPTLQVRGLERDPKNGLHFCSAGEIPMGYGTDDNCGFRWNSTLPFLPTMADIAAMADCSVFDLGDLYDGWVCTRVATVESHSGIPEFSVVVAFKVD